MHYKYFAYIYKNICNTIIKVTSNLFKNLNKILLNFLRKIIYKLTTILIKKIMYHIVQYYLIKKIYYLGILIIPLGISTRFSFFSSDCSSLTSPPRFPYSLSFAGPPLNASFIFPSPNFILFPPSSIRESDLPESAYPHQKAFLQCTSR